MKPSRADLARLAAGGDGPDPANVIQIGIGGTVAVPGAEVTMVQAVHVRPYDTYTVRAELRGEVAGVVVGAL